MGFDETPNSKEFGVLKTDLFCLDIGDFTGASAKAARIDGCQQVWFVFVRRNNILQNLAYFRLTIFSKKI